MQTFTRGELTFDVSDSGPEGGDVVVLLHGYPENRTSWDAVTPLLVEQGFRVLAPDQRGYSPGARPKGRSAYAMQHLAGDIVALLDAAGAESAHIVGHDWGGGVAWALADWEPARVRTVTSLTTPHPRAMLKAMVTGTQAFKSWYMFMFQLPVVPELAYRPQMEQRLRATLRRTGLPDEAIDRYITPLREPGAATAAINWYRGMPLSRRRPGASITVPSLYAYPTGDAFLGRKAADLTGDYVSAPYTYELLDGVSHWMPEEVPDVVARLVTEHARKYG
jgi:pimeloyl-ACP methyl ester carboxylesterase